MIIEGKSFQGKNFEKKMGKAKFAVFLLWMISKKEQHGYEIIQTMQEDRAIPSCAASKIYPILRELHRKGLIKQKEVLQGKRAKKLYTITAKGKQVLQKAKDHVKKSPLLRRYVEDMLR